MDLLVCIVKSHRHVEEILTGYLELGIRGATVLDARGMGQIIAADIPIFAGFRTLFPAAAGGTYLILSVLEAEQVERAERVIDEACGGLDRPGTGFCFTLPVKSARGLAGEIE